MKTIYKNKCSNNLNFILPNNKIECTETSLLNEIHVAVIIHLHYIDTVHRYLEYIKLIPSYIDIIITTSEDPIEQMIKETSFPRIVRVVKKNNRGRDISSFLVACRNLILQYNYICFTHDKKAPNAFLYEDTEKFIQCIWENTLGGTDYINNILSVFLLHSEIGLLVPPAPILDSITAGYGEPGKKNLQLIQTLCDLLDLKTDFAAGIPFIALGTAFWARTSALKKLFNKDWNYSDFTEEPLPKGGTISHGIERILPYVAWDAGYETGWIMTQRYAGEYIDLLYKTIRNAFKRLDKSLGIDSIYKLNNYIELEEKLLNFCNQYKHIYIYGAGVVGQRCMRHIQGFHKKDINIEAFLVTAKPTEEYLFNMPVCQLTKHHLNDDCGIIIAVAKELQQELKENIAKLKGCFMQYIFYN